MGVALVDSSAYIGYLDVGDALHAHAVEVVEGLLRAGSPLAISAVTWAEVLRGAHQGHHDEEMVRGFVADFNVAIVAVDAEVAEQAATLQAQYAKTSRKHETPKLRTPDALILATAVLYADIDTVVCGDGQWLSVPGVDADFRLLRERKRR